MTYDERGPRDARRSTPMNLFDDLPDELPDEFFDVLARSGDVTIERIVSRGHTSPASGWYDQELDEWVLVVQGEATLAFDDGSHVALRAGDHVDIPAHRRHRVTRTSVDPPTLWVAVHRPPSGADRR